MGAADPAAVPRTKLEVLYHEVLGDVAALVGRLEAIQGKMQDLERSHASERAGEVLERAAAVASSRVRADLDHAANQARKHLKVLVEELAASADAAGRVWRWRLYAACAGLSLLSAFVGGSVLLVAHLAGVW